MMNNYSQTWLKTLICEIACFVLLVMNQGWTLTYYVDASQPDDTGDGTSWTTAKRTIQAAVDLTVAGDTVFVTNGVYREGGKAAVANTTVTNRVYSAKNITIRAMSTNPADTVIEGAPDPDTGGCGPKAIRGYRGTTWGGTDYLTGFTITNGYTWSAGGDSWLQRGGGGAHGGVLSNCLIVGNTAQEYGGGHAYGRTYNSIIRNNRSFNMGGGVASASCFNCVISNNTADSTGGGGYSFNAYSSEIVNNTAFSMGGGLSANSMASNCVIRGNTATSTGGAAGFSQVTSYKFYNCLIIENQAGNAGAIYVRSGGGIGILINCTVVSNRAVNAGSCAGLGGGAADPFFLTNSIVMFNYNTTDNVVSNYRFTADSSVVSSCLWPDVTGAAYDNGGNVSGDPLFVGAGNYRLTYRSPCVNSGVDISTLSNDLDNVTRPIDGKGNGIAAYDMGCYEYIPPPAGTIIRIQ